MEPSALITLVQIRQILLTLLLLFNIRPVRMNVDLVEEGKCNEQLFSKPYVILREHKEGPDKEKLEESGIMDLREALRSFVCINGAVVIYKDSKVTTEKVDKGHPPPGHVKHKVQVPEGKTIRFSNGTFKVFSHKCIPLNWVPEGETKRIVGQTAYKMDGIFLLAPRKPSESEAENSSNETKHIQLMMNQKNFGYKVGKAEGTIMDASFIVSGKGPFCMDVGNEDKILMVSEAAGGNENETEICRWTATEADRQSAEYKRFFRKALAFEDYKWTECESTTGEEANATAVNGTTHGPFATFEDASSLLAKNKGKGKKGEEKEKKRSSEEICEDQGSGKPSKYRVLLKDCVKIPQFNPDDPTCKFLEGGGGNCPKLCAALEVDQATGEGGGGGGEGGKSGGGAGGGGGEGGSDSSASSSSESTSSLTMDKIPSLQWKHDVLMFIAVIFSKICVPIKVQSTFQLMRVISNYLVNIHTPEPETGEYSHLVSKPTMWDVIMARLRTCSAMNETKPMDWEITGKPAQVPYPGSKGKKKKGRPKREVGEGDEQAPTKLENSFDDIELKLRYAAALKEDIVEEGKDGDETLDVISIESDEDDEISLIEEEEGDKLIIQRSPSVFDFNDEDESTNEFIFGTIPRFRRDEDETTGGGEEAGGGKETEPGKEVKVPLPTIQEYHPPMAPKPENESSSLIQHSDFIIFPEQENVRVKGKKEKMIYFYEDVAQIAFDLNPVIDAFWKVSMTAFAYCQKYEKNRESAVFPVAFTQFDQYFLSLLKDEWKESKVHQEVNMVLGEFGDEDRKKWLDTCLETAFIEGNALHFRCPRPLDLESIENDDKGGSSSKAMKGNEFIGTPENHGKGNYFQKEPKMPKEAKKKRNDEGSAKKATNGSSKVKTLLS